MVDFSGFNDDKNIEASSGEYTPIPEGWYQARVNQVEEKNSKAGGMYLSVQFEITGESYNNRKVYHNYNVVNSNDQAVQIAKGQLCALTEATVQKHLSEVPNSDVIIGHELLIKVGISKGTNGYKDSNNVLGYKALEDSVGK